LTKKSIRLNGAGESFVSDTKTYLSFLILSGE
jgi:hypothetical protein